MVKVVAIKVRALPFDHLIFPTSLHTSYHQFLKQQRWFEKLHNWEKALEAYETKYEQDPDDHDLLLGRMRSLENLGKWSELHKLASDKWKDVGELVVIYCQNN